MFEHALRGIDQVLAIVTRSKVHRTLENVPEHPCLNKPEPPGNSWRNSLDDLREE